MPTSANLAELQLRLARVRAGEPLIITTSGSTESPKRVALHWPSLEAAARASAAVIGSGNWMLAVPTEYIAGVMVAVRAELAGGTVWPLESLNRFVEVAMQMAEPRYVSLVPAQLSQLLASPESAAALSTFAAVLVGGQSTPQSLRAAAASAGMNIVTTYGSTETAGGCVYNGLPLPGTVLRVDEHDRLWVAGPMLADGFVTETSERDDVRTDAAFVTQGGIRWYRTDDRARLYEEPSGTRLELLGRADSVMISGGLKLDLAEVQRFLDRQFGQDAALAVSIDGTRWGQTLGVWMFDQMILEPAELSVLLRGEFGPAARPVVGAGGDPKLTATQKIDRGHYRELLRQIAAEQGLLDSMVGDV